MCGGDHFHPGAQLVAWNFIKEKIHQNYFPASYLKLLTTSILVVGQLQSRTR